MKATGIVRRIDDLGRVVIPKEIRRTMRIREGDPLEIYTGNNGDVIFKKYSPIGELFEQAGLCCEALAKCTDKIVVVCDRDHCIAAAGIGKKEVLERRITADLEDLIDRRRPYFYSAQNSEKVKALEGVEPFLIAMHPIISAGDLNGAVLMLDENPSYATDVETNLITAAAGFLQKSTEE